MLNRYVNWSPKHVKIAEYVYVGIFPLLLFLLLELVNPISSYGLFLDVRHNLWAIISSVFMIFLLAFILFSFTNNILVSYTVVTIFLLLFYVVNYFKIMITGGVFIPSDFRLAESAFIIMNRDVLIINRLFIIIIMLIFILLLPLYFCKIKITFPKKICAFFVFLIFFAIIHTSGLINEGSTLIRYRNNGLILGFYAELVNRDTHNSFVITPIEITHAFSLSLETNKLIQDKTYNLPPKNPNVIIIMSEAFFDPNVLPNVTFSQNPVSNFHRLAKENLSGRLIVPSWGGGTANTEFEFLGGSPHVFFGSRWYLPFKNYERYFFDYITSAMPWMFRKNGYRTVGIHTFYGTFYNRNIIFPRIGFDIFLSSEYMPDAVYKGDFISDEYFTDRIIEQIILAEEADEPLFLFGISMQNHWPFHEARYYPLKFDVLSESSYLDAEEIGVMNTFLQGIFDADKQLGRLIEFINSRKTPTIVVFFGDHLPILGRHDQKIFEKLGFLTTQDEWSWALGDLVTAFSTHYLVWANYDLQRECFGTVSTFILGAMVAEATGISLNRYFTYLLGGSERLRVLTDKLFMSSSGIMEYGIENRSNLDVLTLEALWNAKMFGEDEFSKSLSILNMSRNHNFSKCNGWMYFE